MWNDLVTSTDPAIQLDGKDQTLANLRAFLRSFFFLRHYPTIPTMARFFRIGKTACKGNAVWYWINKVHCLREKKIIWKERWLDPNSEKFNISVDGVHCKIQEPKHETWSKNPKYYSHKNNTSGLNYEVAISVVDGHCCWVNGPFPAGRNDISIYYEADGLRDKMLTCPGKRAIADLGYRGKEVGKTISTPSSHDSPALRKYKSRNRAKQETFNGRIKNFHVLKETFRHDLGHHKAAFDVCCIAVQYQLETGNPLFS
jgi:hypothetical protein